MQEVVCIGLGDKLALIGLLNKIFIALLLRKQYRILLGLEVQVSTLHGISRRLPAHQGVFPTVTLRQRIPVHPPMVAMPGTRLRCGLRRLVDSGQTICSATVTDWEIRTFNERT